MSGLQTIINSATSIQVNRRRLVGLQYTRNQIVRVGETPGRQPWRLTVKHDRLIPYAQARALTEQLDTLDRALPQQVTFSSNAKLSYLFAYQGQMTNAHISALRVNTFVGSQLSLTQLSTIPLGTVMFEPGDIIQLAGQPYPFTVTTQLVRTSDTNQTATVHRGNFISDSVSNLAVTVGNAVNFYMLCTNMPTYTIIRGGTNALVQFDSDFELHEYTGLEI